MQDNMRLLGKILGELYRIQNRSEFIPCAVSESHIYGLLNGFERSINHEIERIGFISEDELSTVEEILDEYFDDENKLEKLNGFYDIEGNLKDRGIDRSKAIAIMTYLYADHRFTNVIDKIKSGHSPIECQRFELTEWEI